MSEKPSSLLVTTTTNQRSQVRDTRPRSLSRSTAGISLIQILIVIAIIAVVAGLITNVAAEARWMSKRVTCLSHLRQWGIAALGYAQEHKGRVPYSITYWDGPSPHFGKTPYAAWKESMPGLADELTYATMIAYLEGDSAQATTLAKIWTCPTTGLSKQDQNDWGYPCLFMDYSYFAVRDMPPPSWCNAPEDIIVGRPRSEQVLAGDNVGKNMNGNFYFQHGGTSGTPNLEGFRGANQVYSDGHAAWRAVKDWPLQDMRQRSEGGRYLGDLNGNRAYF